MDHLSEINLETNQPITLKHNGKTLASLILTPGSGQCKNDYDLTIEWASNPAQEIPGYYLVRKSKGKSL
jgi:hypothetical protein